ncbi:ABC transporter ATP-binding protein [Hyphobacterium sp. CCMP332]|nr:ABC transporter ATP-binding protein [Hyphobacterium sp. CCMP332]
MILKLRGIQKKYLNSPSRAIRGMSLKVENGEILALLGESGSGKSSLLKIISGRQIADRGKMVFLNEEKNILESNLSGQFEGIRLIDQESQLPLNVSIRVALERQLYDYKKSWVKERISRVSNLCQLKGLLDRKINEISGGQRQRAALALAIADEPRLLLMDEAFTNLDFSLKKEIQMQWINIIREENISVIMVTHDPRDSLMYADRIAVMHKGRIVQRGSPEELYHRPKDLYVSELFGHTTKVKNKFYRPEDFKILNQNGKLKGKVLYKYFQGNGYLYVLKKNTKIYKVYSTKDINKKELMISWEE